jgi:oxygen-independent coproporphyrinogen-3 oxidase
MDLFDRKTIFKKYDVYADDYTDYPHKRNWSRGFGDKQYRDALLKTCATGDSPTLLYFHFPFCFQQCFYCICHKHIITGYDPVLQYFSYLRKEVEMMRGFFDANLVYPDVKEVFLGGGSPTILHEAQFNELVDLINGFCNVKDLDRFCVEVDPRTCPPSKLRYYASKGVNNLSIGVQDFNPLVQQAVNRVQPVGLVRRLLEPDLRQHFNNINIDLLVGLPKQTPETMTETMQQVVYLKPDRVSFCFFHYTADEFHPHMKACEPWLPNFYERKLIFKAGLDVLMKAGYVRTGFEHFALPDDIVAKGVSDGKATYTSLGAIKGATNVIAFGESGHSILGDDYLIQNFYEPELYKGALDNDKFPVYRGMKLSMDDALRRDVIRTLRTYFRVDADRLFKEYFDEELRRLQPLIDDGLVALSNNDLRITEDGRYFTDLIISIFDKYLEPTQFPKIHSRPHPKQL